MNSNLKATLSDNICISKKDVSQICSKYILANTDFIIKNYSLSEASDKMLGFLSDYWRLKIKFTSGNNQLRSIDLFIKSIPKSNRAKAKMVREMNLFEKEHTFYTIIKDKIKIQDLTPWSPNLVTTLKDAMVFEDLNSLNYRTHNKLETFDEHHTLQALQTLARFHASSLIYEEKRTKMFNKPYIIHDDHKKDLDRGGYQTTDLWFNQCMRGALEAVRFCSKYSKNKQIIQMIEDRWEDVWNEALDLSHFSLEYRNVICHRDLWNNNIMFHYKEDGEGVTPDGCMLVDFQAVTCQPPAGDVMFLLCCNLDAEFRETNMNKFLNYYYRELESILGCCDVNIGDILPLKQFFDSCDKYKLWALIVTACLTPTFRIDDDLTKKFFCNSVSFEEIFTNDKASFIKTMIENNNEYRNRVMQVFEEIVDTYCLFKEV